MKKRILVVDDEPDAVQLIQFNLRGAGFDVAAAADGAEALRKARADTYDLIVLDLMLPEIGGLDVCKLLRRDPATAQVPIVMFTAKAAEPKFTGVRLDPGYFVVGSVIEVDYVRIGTLAPGPLPPLQYTLQPDGKVKVSWPASAAGAGVDAGLAGSSRSGLWTSMMSSRLKVLGPVIQ